MSREIRTLLPYFGSNRMNAALVGELLKPCAWVGIPFAGGMPEVLQIEALTIAVNDLHFLVVNLARAVQRGESRMIRYLSGLPFHPHSLREAQDRLTASLPHVRSIVEKGSLDFTAAQDYFVTQWMGRSGKAGTKSELRGSLPVRWKSGGGDSCKRYRSAIQGIRAFSSSFRICNFTALDCFDFIDKALAKSDFPDSGLYSDAPWVGVGQSYVRNVDDVTFHEMLHDKLSLFRNARIVVRYGDCSEIRKLYREDCGWGFREINSKKQSGASQAEVFIVRN